jgi:DHA1 family bicyclomycin/chloramphenicol resistance-like MFS transporter
MSAVVPALPSMARTLGASNAALQSSLTACVIGLALGQTIVGPWSDRIGRRGPLLIGLAVWTAAPLAAAVTPNVAVLDALRLAQGIGGGFALALSRAIVRDLAEPQQLLKAYTRLALVSGVAPIVSPLLGSALLQVVSWRGVFIALAVVGAVTLLGCARVLPESHHPPAGGTDAAVPRGWRSTAADYRALLSAPSFLVPVTAVACGYASVFAYVSVSSFIYEQKYGVSALVFSLLFGLNGLGNLLASQASVRTVRSFGRVRAVSGALAMGICASVALLVADRAVDGAAPGAWVALAIPLFVLVASAGLIVPPSTSWAMAGQAARAGTASGLLGLIQFGTGALAATIAGLTSSSALSLGLTTCGCMSFAFTVLVIGAVRRRPDPTTAVGVVPRGRT